MEESLATSNDISCSPVNLMTRFGRTPVAAKCEVVKEESIHQSAFSDTQMSPQEAVVTAKMVLSSIPMTVQQTFNLMPSEILDSPHLDQPSEQSQHIEHFCDGTSSLLLPLSPPIKVATSGLGSPTLKPFDDEPNGHMEELEIKPVPVAQDDSSDWKEEDTDSSIFSPNKLVDCFVVHSRDERRHRIESLEAHLREELENVQAVPLCLVERLRELRMTKEANMKRN